MKQRAPRLNSELVRSGLELGVDVVKVLKDLGRFSFGATSSTVTSLGLVFGFLEASNPRASIIGALLLIAVADNIADSLGFHVYRESVSSKPEKIRIFTLSNFITGWALQVFSFCYLRSGHYR